MADDTNSDVPDVRPLVVIDLEASCLPTPGSFPIEAAVAYVQSSDARSWLIRPDERWIKAGRWDPAAEALHGISQQDLVTSGLPVDVVQRELADAVVGHSVLSDAVTADGFWLRILYGRSPPFHLEPLSDLLLQATGLTGVAARDKLRDAYDEARRRIPREHRAEPDARRWAEVIRILTGLSP